MAPHVRLSVGRSVGLSVIISSSFTSHALIGAALVIIIRITEIYEGTSEIQKLVIAGHIKKQYQMNK